MARPTWDCTDPRDRHKDEWTFTVYRPDEVGDLHRGCWCVVYVLAVPAGRLEDALPIERVVTDDVQGTARGLLAALAGTGELSGANGQPDPDLGRNLRNRATLHGRDHKIEIMLAVHFDRKVAAKKPARPSPPTPAMLQLTIERLQTEGYGGQRWHAAVALEDLPEPPHAKMTFSIIGVDGNGNVNGTIPRPPVADPAFGRNLRQFAHALVQHPQFAETTLAYCAARSLTPLYVYRQARAA